jgi:tRNA-splicing ligase RtcB
MDPKRFERISDYEWRLSPTGAMRVPGVIFADETLILDMDNKVGEQIANVATLPGIVAGSFAMPDAHWGYGFPIGGVAAFDPDRGGIVSAGGVGFDISCGVRLLTTGLPASEIVSRNQALADSLFREIPAGVGSRGKLNLRPGEIDEMLIGGAEWAIGQGYGNSVDLDRIEERGRMSGARPECVSNRAKQRQHEEMGTLGSGNHYLEIQQVTDIIDRNVAAGFGLAAGEAVVSIHCGSRGLGHQLGSEFLREMAIAEPDFGIVLPDRELACAPINSEIGRRYLGAMRAAINCAIANRQIITHLVREVFAHFFPAAELPILFDVSHNTCKLETHVIDGSRRDLYVHRKGATRAYGPGHSDLCEPLRAFGQPVLIGGSMGTASFVLAGSKESEHRAFSSACHGAGRSVSRHAALKLYYGREIVDTLAREGVIIRSPSMRGVAEEAPGAYKDVDAVVDAADRAGLARKIARLRPLICIKG